MPNTNVTNLAEEVADLLRHDNLDSRILQWIQLTWNDLCQRFVSDLTTDFTSVTIATGSTATLSSNVGTMRAVIAVDTGGTLYIPTEITGVDYSRVTLQDSASVGSPRFWTIEMTGAGTQQLKVWPPVASSTVFTLLWAGNPRTTDLAGTDYLKLPYWAEHVIIWGAAAYGSLALDRTLYPIFMGEFERLLQDLVGMNVYRPDTVPVLRSVAGPYAGTPRMAVPPRIPETIG